MQSPLRPVGEVGVINGPLLPNVTETTVFVHPLLSLNEATRICDEGHSLKGS